MFHHTPSGLATKVHPGKLAQGCITKDSGLVCVGATLRLPSAAAAQGAASAVALGTVCFKAGGAEAHRLRSPLAKFDMGTAPGGNYRASTRLFRRCGAAGHL